MRTLIEIINGTKQVTKKVAILNTLVNMQMKLLHARVNQGLGSYPQSKLIFNHSQTLKKMRT